MRLNYIALSIPIFFLLIGIELLVGFLKHKKLYRFNDAITNINLGIGQQTISIMMKGVLFVGYLFIFENRIYTFENNWISWLILFLGVDFFYYWFHRASHEINVLWAAHIVHHQSEDYNLSVALRQSWFQEWFSWMFYLPLALIGFDPVMFVAVSTFNTLYQFWIHTTTIKTLGPLEWIINTPSHHRVHHGSNPKYIDKNHAGSLIIWDKLFGTFAKEEEEPVYGITSPLKSWNPIWANLHYWKELWELAKQSKGLDKIKVFLKSPGWRPSYLGGFQTPQEIYAETYKKYDRYKLRHGQLYILFVFLISLGISSLLLFYQDTLSPIPLGATVFYLLL
ncbi:sterol desaturase family protein, partial [Bacteroidota bacterium]